MESRINSKPQSTVNSTQVTDEVKELENQNSPNTNEISIQSEASTVFMKYLASERASLSDLAALLQSVQINEQFNANSNLNIQSRINTVQGQAPTSCSTAATSAIADAIGQAVDNGDLPKVQKLLQDPCANINAKDSNGSTPLMHAAANGQNRILEFLISKNADLNLKDSLSRTAIYLAAETGHADAIRILRKNQADPNIPAGTTALNRTPLMQASINGNLESVMALTETIIDKTGKRSVGVDVNVRDANDRTALMEAASKGNTQIVEELLKQYADYSAMDTNHTTVLMEAAGKGNAATTKLVLDKIAALNDSDLRSSLVNAQDNQKRTALMVAAKNLNGASVEILLKANPKPQLDLQDKDGQTALIHAVESGDLRSVKALVDAGAGLNIKSNNGETALSMAKKLLQTTSAPGVYSEIIKILENPKSKP